MSDTPDAPVSEPMIVSINAQTSTLAATAIGLITHLDQNERLEFESRLNARFVVQPTSKSVLRLLQQVGMNYVMATFEAMKAQAAAHAEPQSEEPSNAAQ